MTTTPTTREYLDSQPMRQPLCQTIASLVDARKRCDTVHNRERFDRHTATLEQIAQDLLPSGSGIYNGTQIDLDRSTGEKLVFTTAYHSRDDAGYSCKWINGITVTVKPSLMFGIDVAVRGSFGAQWDIKEMMLDLFSVCLSECYGGKDGAK